MNGNKWLPNKKEDCSKGRYRYRTFLEWWNRPVGLQWKNKKIQKYLGGIYERTSIPVASYEQLYHRNVSEQGNEPSNIWTDTVHQMVTISRQSVDSVRIFRAHQQSWIRLNPPESHLGGTFRTFARLEAKKRGFRQSWIWKFLICNSNG